MFEIFKFDMLSCLQYHQNQVTLIDSHTFQLSSKDLVHNVTENTNNVFNLRPFSTNVPSPPLEKSIPQKLKWIHLQYAYNVLLTSIWNV